jgi:hypothetical protein
VQVGVRWRGGGDFPLVYGMISCVGIPFRFSDRELYREWNYGG